MFISLYGSEIHGNTIIIIIIRNCLSVLLYNEQMK